MTIENSNLEQKGAVFILFLGIMVAIMSAASLLQKHYATNDDQIYNSVIKKQVIATAESAINKIINLQTTQSSYLTSHSPISS